MSVTFLLALSVLSNVSVGLIFLSCSSKETKPGQTAAGTAATATANNGVALSSTMQKLKNALENLLPDLADSKGFQDPANHDRLQKEIGDLAAIASKVSHNPIKEKMDPSFAFLSEGFNEEINRASEAFNTGKVEFARYSLMNVNSFCIECHTRTSTGPAFDSAAIDQKLSKLKPLERGEFLLATRQFDEAAKQFEAILENRQERFQFLEFDRALRYVLAITVRFQRDPVKTEKVIQTIKSSPQAPFYLKQAALSWEQSVREWKDERKKAGKKAPTSDELLAKAENLIKKGRQEQVGISDRSGDVDLLRGLSELHQLLVTSLDKNQLGHALFLTGQGYEAIRDLALWSLHENYFESCVRRVPHTTWALSCYKSLEESLIMGFTGSAGTKLPYDVQLRLTELETLAKPETIPEEESREHRTK
ncbi:MAG: hypothetical protein C5B49_07430 [Bdellovibrio sp.]|nr:MAG: hypothetical protein C5B49_07430 [Bdellovibrio sp.]